MSVSFGEPGLEGVCNYYAPETLAALSQGKAPTDCR
jgi:hypothetical protein